jgi:hypothetical protein
MTAVVLGLPSPGDACLTRATIPVQRSPRLGELVVTIGQVPGWEEDHVIAVAKGHELQAPKPDHRGQREWTFGVSHPEKWLKNDVLLCSLLLYHLDLACYERSILFQ